MSIQKRLSKAKAKHLHEAETVVEVSPERADRQKQKMDSILNESEMEPCSPLSRNRCKSGKLNSQERTSLKNEVARKYTTMLTNRNQNESRI